MCSGKANKNFAKTYSQLQRSKNIVKKERNILERINKVKCVMSINHRTDTSKTKDINKKTKLNQEGSGMAWNTIVDT